MTKQKKRAWKSPSVQSLPVKEITLSGTEPAPNEAGGQVDYTPRHFPS